MKEIKINIDWDFKNTVTNIETLKKAYDSFLTSFSIFDPKNKGKFIKKIRDAIYSLKIREWEKELIWSYMNDYEQLDTLLECAKRRK